MTTSLHRLARLISTLAILAVVGSAAAGEGSQGGLGSQGGEVFELRGDVLSVRAAGTATEVSLRAPTFALGDMRPTGNTAPASVRRTTSGEPAWELSYAPLSAGGSATLEVRVELRWSRAESLLRKRAKFRLVGARETRLLKEVVLDRIAAPGRSAWTHAGGGPGLESRVPLEGPQSHPAFLVGRFVGVEYPVASTRRESDAIVLAHRPGLRVQPDTWHETRAAVYGLAARGDEVGAFQRYIAAHRPAPKGLHVNYNSWWTSPVPYTEKDILDLMKTFEDRLTRAHGAAMDTFAIDLGWSNAKSVWEIDAKLFPAGFARIRDAARGMQSHLGLWISPSSCYPPALDGVWAKSRGYEALPAGPPGSPANFPLLCLGGKRYGEQFKVRMADLVGRWGIHHLKLDGCFLECPESDHGHEPGPFSSEAIAGGLIAAVEAARRANPNVWIETTCFGYNPSPWWLFHANSVIGTFGDDAPVGRVPSPVYRESYTTARDYFNLQGAALLPIPAGAQEVLGVVHQSPEPFTNDAIVTVMRGHSFLPLYVNPKYMNDARWRSLAAILGWARANAGLLEHTTPLLPAAWQGGKTPAFTDAGVMPREPYGYAHVRGGRGLVLVRNPWIAPTTYALALDKSLGFTSDARDLSAVSLYPEPRVYGKGLRPGDVVAVPLAPYETVVLSLRSGADVAALPPAAQAVRSQLRVGKSDAALRRITLRGADKAMGPDWTCPLGGANSAVQWTIHAAAQVNAPQAELLLLLEGDKSPVAPIGKLAIDGREVTPTTATSAGGWSATGLPTHEQWTFLRAPLTAGEHRIDFDGFLGDDCREASAWIVAGKPGAIATPAGALPQPERLSLDGAALMAPGRLAQLPAATAAIDRPIERIDGVFLDALEPVSASQGWGKLQKNQSVWEKPMMIGGRRYQRGLGTHAPSKIVYSLDGKYRRFQAWAGADANNSPTVTFEVRVDGVVRWSQGLTTRDTPAAWVDVDIAGAKTLELRVGDAGDVACDHADWAEARLVR